MTAEKKIAIDILDDVDAKVRDQRVIMGRDINEALTKG